MFFSQEVHPSSPLPVTSMTIVNEHKTSHQQSTPTTDVDYQHLLSVANEKQRQQLQEVSGEGL